MAAALMMSKLSDVLVFSAPQGAADDGGSVLLRRRLLHPQEDVPVAAEGRAGFQRLLHQASRHHSRYGAKL